jgi:MarR family transcriptional regulator for hemolysin
MTIVMAYLPLEEDLLFLIHDTARMIGIHVDRLARQHGMSRAQWVLLIKLDRHPGLSQRDLAEFMEVEPITVGRLIDKLEARGLVTRKPDDQDRRVWRVHLLPAAQPYLAEIGLHRAEIAELVGRGIPPAMAETLRQGLIRSKSNVAAALRAQASDSVPRTEPLLPQDEALEA